ncbi:MAG: transposase [Actinobacteria bacterium]|nr:transposase [Actinomycetota bacterium]
MLTDIGAVDLAVPRDRNGSFEPQIVGKGQPRLEGFNERIIALYARGMTTRDICAHLRQMYEVEVSPDLISRVTDGVIEELAEWQSRPLDRGQIPPNVANPIGRIRSAVSRVEQGFAGDEAALLRADPPGPQRAGRPQGALPGGAEPGGVPQAAHRDPQLGLETGAASVHDLLRGPDPHPMKPPRSLHRRSDAPPHPVPGPGGPRASA